MWVIACCSMAVANRNPHRLQYLVAVPGYEDENGNYHAGSSEWKGSIPCDAVPSGKAEERKFEDGVVSHTFTIGDRVKIMLLGGIEREFEVKGFHRYQLQCKIWV